MASSSGVRRFVLPVSPTEVVIGPGASRALGEEAARLGLTRALVVSTRRGRELAEGLAASLGPRAVGVVDLAREHVPAEVVAEGEQTARRLAADLLIPVGGGSTVGLAKAIALGTGIPIVAVPTTYSGSEMTPIWGISDRGEKRTGRDDRVRSRLVLYDPRLSVDLPASVAVPSAFNALAHAVEASYAADLDDDTAALAEESVRELAACLPALAEETRDLAARERALHGACLAGACLGRASMGLHHKLCHVLGGSFGLPHARTHAALLPFVARFNLEAAPRARAALSRALGADDPASALFRLAVDCGVHLGLGELGLPRDAIDHVVALTLATPYPNPRPVSAAELRALLEAAYRGAPAGSRV